MGRPRLAADKKRSLRIAVRLDYADVLDLRKSLKDGADSLVGLIRTKSLERKRPEPVPEIEGIALQLLNEYGHRINEAARAANQGAPITLTARDLAELSALLKRIRRDMRS